MSPLRDRRDDRAQRLLAQYVMPPALAVCVGAAPLVPQGWALGLACAAGVGAALAVRGLLARARVVACERRELGEQLVQSQKLAVLGELSSGIAHEINTPLAIIEQEVELLGMEAKGAVPDEVLDRLTRRFDSIRSQVHRCGDITHGMLQLVRKAEPVLQHACLAELCEDMALLADREAARREVTIERNYDEAMPEVRTSPPQLKQVVLNLLVNAVQAVGKRGTVRITVRPEHEGSALIEVRDDGPGIPPEHLDRIFNPFFTTKPPGQGTGLGLSVCLGIVDRLGGTLGAANAPEGGAVFSVRLPMANSSPGAAPGDPREEAA